MKKSEAEALQQAYDIIGAVLEGKAPPAAAAPAPAPAPRRAKAREVAEGEVDAYYDEKSGGFLCNHCNVEPMKVGETALHLYQEHDILLADANIDGLTHGRKWQMKKYLEKNAPKALKGYGKKKRVSRAAKPPTPPAVKPARGWRKPRTEEPVEEAFEEEALEETQPGEISNLALWHPEGEEDHTVAVEIVGQWREDSPNIQIKEIDATPGAGKVLSVPKKHVFVRGNPPGSYLGMTVGPLEAPEAEGPAEGVPSWRRGPAVRKPARPGKPKVSRADEGFADKYGLSGKQLKYVKEFAEEKGLTLEEAADELKLEEE